MYKDLHINHIVAMAENRVIGREGGMPWHLPEDFKFFKQTTMNCPVIMGRKTWDSIGRPLPGRTMIVVSRKPAENIPQTILNATSIEEAYELCLANKSTWGTNIFIIGGGELYRQTLTHCDKIYLTLVHKKVEGDTSYPDIPLNRFKEISSKDGYTEEPKITFKVFSQ